MKKNKKMSAAYLNKIIGFLNKFHSYKVCIATMALLISTSFLQAQIEVSPSTIPPYTPQALIEDILLGSGVEILNIQYDGDNESIGYFNKGLESIGINEGIVLTTGVASTAGANIGIVEPGSVLASANSQSTATDPDIDFLAEGEDVFNLSKYTITFVPSSDQMSFKYVFASEEYPEFGCTPYNDFFGFFISGPGFSGIYENGGENIALIPGTNLPVSINNIHPQNPNPNYPSCTPVFPEFFNDNDGSANFPVYDGFLDVFTATATVVPCETYTIKLVIADISDTQRDSGVFFEAKSFSSNGFSVSANSQSLDGTVVEGCTDGSFEIITPSPAASDINIDYQMVGDAINGVDYESISGNIIIPAGQTSVSIPVIPILDSNIEGFESIGIDIQINDCTRDTFYLYLRDPSLETPDLGEDILICAGESVPLNGTITINSSPSETFSSTSAPLLIMGPVGSNPPIPTFMDIEVDGFNPPQLRPDLIQSVCMNIQHSVDEDLDIYLYAPGGQFMPLTTDNGGMGDHYTNTCFSPDATDDITFGMQFAPASAAPFTGTFQPEGDWNNLYFGDSPVNGTWRLLAIDDESGFTGAIQDWSITFNSTYDASYSWSPTEGLSCTDCPTPVATPTTTTTYTLTISDTYGCQTSDDITITVIEAYDAPTVNCTDVSTESITFNWNEVDNAEGYEVSINGQPWEAPNNGTTSFIIDGLAGDEEVTIEVRATGPCDALIGTTTCTTLNCTTFSVNVVAEEPSCAGGNDGSITLSSDGDNLPHSYVFLSTNEETLIGQWSDLTPDIYDIMVIDAIGCTETFQIPVLDAAPITSTVNLVNNIDCDNETGSATVQGMGGLAIYDYVWSNMQTGNTLTTNIIGEYFVTITDGLGCETIDSIEIISEGMLQVSASANTICPNTTEGEAIITITTGTEPIVYAWDANADNQTTQTATNLAPGAYFVTVTSADNCEQIVSATVNSFAETVLEIMSNDASCGNADGTATVSVLNPVGTYTYSWSDANNQTTETATALLAGEYFVTVTDENNCETVISTSITTPSSIVLDDLTNTDASCFGLSNGTVSVLASGGTPPLSYSLNTIVQDNGDYDGLAAGNYSMIVTDASDCSTSFDFEIEQPDQIVATENILNNINCDTPNGTATFDLNGGIEPYTYLWSNMQTDPILSTTTAGEYFVTITDNIGCEVLESLTITQDAVLEATVTATPTCFDTNTGSATVTIQSGTEPIEYAWDINAGNQDQPTATNLAPGDYEVTVSDASNCEQILTITVNAFPEINLQTSATDADCNGAPDGTATANAMGGSAPFSYLWNDPNAQTTPTATELSAGQYIVTVTDANGCISIASANVLTPSLLAIENISASPVTCFDDDDGAATVTVSGGTGNFEYLWSDGQTSETATGLTSGDYSVSVSDEEGCEITGTVTIENGIEITASFSTVDVICANDTNGSINLTVEGGTAPYTYVWSTMATTQNITNLSAGNYEVVITDFNNCSITASTPINTTAPIEFTLTSTDASCAGESDGAISSTIMGGQEPYSFIWSNGSNNSELNNISAGVYDVTATDANGCGVFQTIEVTEPTPVEADIELIEPLCFGENNGSLIVTAIGGNPDFTYSIDGENYQTESTFENLFSQNYTLSILDANGCSFEETYLLSEPALLTVNVGEDVRVELGERIYLEALIGGGTGETIFSWESPEDIIMSCEDCFNPYALANNFGEATVTVVDENGCTAEDALFINVDKNHKLFVPNAFTPDNDGINDVLMPYSKPETFIESFVIFDRWGNKVFESGQFFALNQEGWDGKFKGQLVDSGVYVWYVEASFIDGENVLFKGDVTVIK